MGIKRTLQRVFLTGAVLLLWPTISAHAIEGVGGGPTSAGVNQYSPQGCGARWDASTCNAPKVQQAIDKIYPNFVEPLQWMTGQLATAMVHQTEIVGAMFDSAQQLRTQRLYDVLKTRAHKDYHPSDQMCRFGSSIRSLAHTEQRADLNKHALNKIFVDRYTGQNNLSSDEGYASDIDARLSEYKKIFCDPQDNNRSLNEACKDSKDPARYNRDIDFARTLAGPLTLEVNFADEAGSPEEENIVALGKNLYWPRAFDPTQDLGSKSYGFQEARSIMARYVIAHNSFVTQAAMKSQSPDDLGPQAGTAYIKAFLKDFELSTDDIDALLGKNPSYYAQMEVLTKKIYQNPDFYTNLYDKPVNIDRINAAMRAIQTMQNRDRLETQMRAELLSSQLVEDALAGTVDLTKAQAQQLRQE